MGKDFLPEKEWKRAVRERLDREDARLLLEIQATKTCIHDGWLKKVPPGKRRRIERMVERALERRLLFRVSLSFSSAVLFRIKKNEGRKADA